METVGWGQLEAAEEKRGRKILPGYNVDGMVGGAGHESGAAAGCHGVPGGYGRGEAADKGSGVGWRKGRTRSGELVGVVDAL